MIEYEDFAKLDIRMGTILAVEPVPETDKLLQLTIDLGEEKPRTLVSGIREYFGEPEVLVGHQVPVIVNLKPRTLKGVTSEGMVLYVVSEEMLTTLSPKTKVPNGTPVR